MPSLFGYLRRRWHKKPTEKHSRSSSFEASAVVEPATPERPSVSLPPSEPQTPTTQPSVRARSSLSSSEPCNGPPAMPVPQADSPSSLQMPTPVRGHQHHQSLTIPGPIRPHSRASSQSALSVPSSYSVNPDYQVVEFEEDAASDVSPEIFYGALFDEHKRPTDIFKRMVDALFFYMDKRCDVRRFRNTNVVEPEKYAWMLQRRGISQTAILILETNIRTYYDAGKVPYEMQERPDGTDIPVLDRKGWLMLQVFEARSNPQHAYDFWDWVVMVCNLRDPLTGIHLPAPLPRQSFFAEPDSITQRAYHAWRKTATASTPKARTSPNQETAPNMPVPNSPDANSSTSPSTQPASPAAAADASVPPLSIPQPQQPAPASGGTVEALAGAVSSIAGAVQAFAPGGGGNSSPTSTMGPTMMGPGAPFGYGAGPTPFGVFGQNPAFGSPMFGTQNQQPPLGININLGS